MAPIRSSSPSSSLVSTTRWPLTQVPLALSRSRRTHKAPSRWISAWLRLQVLILEAHFAIRSAPDGDDVAIEGDRAGTLRLVREPDDPRRASHRDGRARRLLDGVDVLHAELEHERIDEQVVAVFDHVLARPATLEVEPVARAEVFDHDAVVVDDHACVLATDPIGHELERAGGIAPDHVDAVLEHLASDRVPVVPHQDVDARERHRAILKPTVRSSRVLTRL